MRKEAEKKLHGHAHDEGHSCCGLAAASSKYDDVMYSPDAQLSFEFHLLRVDGLFD
jgi:hypothetical protein